MICVLLLLYANHKFYSSSDITWKFVVTYVEHIFEHRNYRIDLKCSKNVKIFKKWNTRDNDFPILAFRMLCMQSSVSAFLFVLMRMQACVLFSSMLHYVNNTNFYFVKDMQHSLWNIRMLFYCWSWLWLYYVHVSVSFHSSGLNHCPPLMNPLRWEQHTTPLNLSQFLLLLKDP